MRGDARVPFPLGVTQSIATSGAGAVRTSAGVGAQTRKVKISATSDAPLFYAFGDSTVVASATAGTYLGAGDADFVQIRPGQYVSIIRDGSTDAAARISEFGY